MKELCEIQTRISVGKNRENKFGDYHYWRVDDIIQAALPILAEQKCFVTLNDELFEFMGRPFIKATATLTSAETKESVATTAYAELCIHKGMSLDQCTGAASTYARKYALCGLFAVNDDSAKIEPQRDPDELDGTMEQPKQPRQNKAAAKAPAKAKPAKPEMTPEKWAKTITMAAMGKKTADGILIRDWYIQTYNPGQKQIEIFDKQVGDKQTELLMKEQQKEAQEAQQQKEFVTIADVASEGFDDDDLPE